MVRTTQKIGSFCEATGEQITSFRHPPNSSATSGTSSFKEEYGKKKTFVRKNVYHLLLLHFSKAEQTAELR